MPYLVLKYNGTPFAAIAEASLSHVDAHIRNGFPQCIELIGDISGEIVDAVPILSAPPITEATEISSLSNWKTLFRVLVWMVNEIRGLQGKQPITRAQALSAIASLPK